MRVSVLAFAAASLLAAPALAQETGDASPLGAIYLCADLAGDAERLACYDGAVADLRGKETRGEVVAVDSEKVREIERDAFGFSLPSLPKLFSRAGMSGGGDALESAETEAVVLEIARTTSGANGVRLIMTNGQIWLQVDGRPIKEFRVKGHQAHIRRAALGSFVMEIDGKGLAYRVRREE